MICRLCLMESDDILHIFTDTGEMAQKQILKVVAKHFQIEIRYEDVISNIVCSVCWGHLDDFHKFWLSIEDKQKNIQSHLEGIQIKRDIEEVDEEAGAYDETDKHQENINTELCEPEIDIFVGESDIYADETDELQFDATAMKDEESSTNLYSDVSPLIPTACENSSGGVKQSEPPRKALRSTKRVAGKCKRDDPENHSLKDKKKAEKNQTKSLMQELDEFIAENTQLSCCLCSVPLKNFIDLKKHFRQIHHCGGYVICCNNRYRRPTLYVDHLKLHKDPDYFKCALCNKQLASRNNYKNHMNTKHPDNENLIYACKSCPRKFAKQYILDYHLKYNHITERNHICEICSKGFTNSAALKQHKKLAHSNASESVCEICGKCLKTAQNLITHMESIHSTDPPPKEQCKICFKWLKNSRCLKKHMMAHRDQISGTKYKCPQCGVEKNTKPALADHIRYHHSEKVFTCPICNKDFKTLRALKEHESTHTGTYLYTCSFCPKTFRSHGNMHKHKVSNHS